MGRRVLQAAVREARDRAQDAEAKAATEVEEWKAKFRAEGRERQRAEAATRAAQQDTAAKQAAVEEATASAVRVAVADAQAEAEAARARAVRAEAAAAAGKQAVAEAEAQLRSAHADVVTMSSKVGRCGCAVCGNRAADVLWRHLGWGCSRVDVVMWCGVVWCGGEYVGLSSLLVPLTHTHLCAPGTYHRCKRHSWRRKLRSVANQLLRSVRVS